MLLQHPAAARWGPAGLKAPASVNFSRHPPEVFQRRPSRHPPEVSQRQLSAGESQTAPPVLVTPLMTPLVARVSTPLASVPCRQATRSCATWQAFLALPRR